MASLVEELKTMNSGLQHSDINGQVQSGREGFGLGYSGVRLHCRIGGRW